MHLRTDIPTLQLYDTRHVLSDSEYEGANVREYIYIFIYIFSGKGSVAD